MNDDQYLLPIYTVLHCELSIHTQKLG